MKAIKFLQTVFYIGSYLAVWLIAAAVGCALATAIGIWTLRVLGWEI
jgi:hypothetical protein